MPVFRKEILRAGSFKTRQGSLDVSPRRLAGFVETFRAMRDKGHRMKLLREHAPLGSDEGAPLLGKGKAKPLSARDLEAAHLKNTVGTVTDLEVKDDRLYALMDVPIAEAAKQLEDRRVEFVSPEIRDSYTNVRGETYRDLLSHVALTHQPVNAEQGPFEPIHAVQFSLADYQNGDRQMADDEKPDDLGDKKPADEGGDKGGAPEVTPPGDKPAESDNTLADVIAWLEKDGLSLPNDTTPDTFMGRLLAALKTKAAVEDKNKEPEADQPDALKGLNGPADAKPESPPIQLSAMHGKLVEAGRKLVATGVASAAAAGKLTPILRDKLNAYAKNVQFSAAGDEKPRFTLSQVVALLDETIPANLLRGKGGAQLSGAKVEDHPGGDGFYRESGDPTKPEPLTGDAAKKVADAFLARTGGTLPAKP